ncbi:4'-phosphopantetheinyl transferase family protein [Kitasatospora sp. NPDC054939]
MISELLPDTVVTEVAHQDLPWEQARLEPAEAAAVARAVDSRRREFATVRRCARAALGRLGVPYRPLVPGVLGAPSWPDGVVGSMTHCAGYRAAAVARTGDLRSLGIDAEEDAPLPDDVLGTIALPEEQKQVLELLATRSEVAWDRLLFSAKESVYKAWFPLTGRFLDFSEAELRLGPDGTFEARLLVPGPVVDGRTVEGFEGRWVNRDGLLATAIAVLPR